MTETTMAPEHPDLHSVSLEELTGMPAIERLNPEAALQPCDGHASGGVNAVVSVLYPGTAVPIVLCGHCARKHFGYEHTAHAPEVNRQKGSDH